MAIEWPPEATRYDEPRTCAGCGVTLTEGVLEALDALYGNHTPCLDTLGAELLRDPRVGFEIALRRAFGFTALDACAAASHYEHCEGR